MHACLPVCLPSCLNARLSPDVYCRVLPCTATVSYVSPAAPDRSPLTTHTYTNYTHTYTHTLFLLLSRGYQNSVSLIILLSSALPAYSTTFWGGGAVRDPCQSMHTTKPCQSMHATRPCQSMHCSAHYKPSITHKTSSTAHHQAAPGQSRWQSPAASGQGW